MRRPMPSRRAACMVVSRPSSVACVMTESLCIVVHRRQVATAKFSCACYAFACTAVTLYGCARVCTREMKGTPGDDEQCAAAGGAADLPAAAGARAAAVHARGCPPRRHESRALDPERAGLPQGHAGGDHPDTRDG